MNRIVSFFLSLTMFGYFMPLRSQVVTEIKRPAITGIGHVAFYSKDVENTRSFYKGFLGFAEPYSLMAENGKDLSLTFIKINDKQVVEIFPEKEAGSDRFFHFGLVTTDAEAMRKYLESKAIKVPTETKKGRIGNYNFFVNDPNGTICEIVQYGKEGYTIKNTGKDLPETRIAKRMSHIGFMVKDLDAAMRFYCEILDFKEIWRGGNDSNVTWVHLQLPEGTDFIELMLYDKEPDAKQRGVLNHICLEVPDIPNALDTLKSRTIPAGCTMTNDFRIGRNRKRQINCYDADLTRVELMEEKTIDGKPTPTSTLPPLKFIDKN